VIICGLILLVIGFVTGIAAVWTIGMIVLVVGLVLWLLGAMGHGRSTALLLTFFAGVGSDRTFCYCTTAA
jgi:Flp pilus assembly protein protease CpaA